MLFYRPLGTRPTEIVFIPRDEAARRRSMEIPAFPRMEKTFRRVLNIRYSVAYFYELLGQVLRRPVDDS